MDSCSSDSGNFRRQVRFPASLISYFLSSYPACHSLGDMFARWTSGCSPMIMIKNGSLIDRARRRCVQIKCASRDERRRPGALLNPALLRHGLQHRAQGAPLFPFPTPPSSRARFVDEDNLMLIDAANQTIPSCVSPGRPEKYEAITAGEYVKTRAQATYGH